MAVVCVLNDNCFYKKVKKNFVHTQHRQAACSFEVTQSCDKDSVFCLFKNMKKVQQSIEQKWVQHSIFWEVLNSLFWLVGRASSMCHVCDSVQVSRGSWFVKSRQIHRSRATLKTCSKLRRRSCAMSSGRETFTLTPGTSWASTRMVSFTFRTELETLSGVRPFCFLLSFDCKGRKPEPVNTFAGGRERTLLQQRWLTSSPWATL